MPLDYDIHPPKETWRNATTELLRNQGMQQASWAECVVQMGAIQARRKPIVSNPVVLLFGAGHGFTAAYFPDVHIQQENIFSNILNKESGVNRSLDAQIQLKLVDAGLHGGYRNYLNFWLHMGEMMELPGHWDGSDDFTTQRAMESRMAKKAMKEGARLADKYHQKETNCLVLGTVGKSSWFAAQMLAALALPCALEHLVSDEALRNQFANMPIDTLRLQRKLRAAIKRNPTTHDLLTQISLYGAPDIAMMVGAILKAASLQMTLVLDGVAAVTAAIIAHSYHPHVGGYLLMADWPHQNFREATASKLHIPSVFHADLGLFDGTSGVWAVRHLQNMTEQL